MSDTYTTDAPEDGDVVTVTVSDDGVTVTVTDGDAPETPTDPATDATEVRSTPTDLEGDLRTVLNAIVTGEITLPEGKKATPHVLAGLIQANRGPEAVRPSSGAVAAALVRWTEVGFISMSESPSAFEDYTDAGRSEGLAALKAAHRGRLNAARAAIKAAAKAAEPPAPEPEPVVEPVAPTVDTSSPF